MRSTFFFLVFVSLSISSFEQVGINATGAPANQAAGLDVNFNNLGFLPPRLSTSERNAIANPVNGLQIFNTSNNCIEYYVNGDWYSLCGTCPAPTAPSGLSGSSASSFQFSITWNAVAGATSYRLDISQSNTFSNFVYIYNDLGVGNVTSYLASNLSPGTTYYFRVRSVNSCGTSVQSSVASYSTSSFNCGSATQAVAHNPSDGVSAVVKSVTYGTVFFNGRCWTDRNLGSAVIPGSATDNTEASAGWYWQFNRKQGRQNTGGTSNTPSWDTTPINENSSWISSQDPCTLILGNGWRLPTSAEWISADAAGGWNGYGNTYSSPLKLHAGGYLNLVTGALENRGAIGTYWSATQNSATTAWDLDIQNGSCFIYESTKAYALPLRCTRDI